MMTDGQLLTRYTRTGSEEAFRELVERYHPMVYTCCHSVLENASEVEDATQTVFLLLCKHANRLHHSSESLLAGWLFKTARHVGLRMRRTQMNAVLRERRSVRDKEGGEVTSDPLADQDYLHAMRPHLYEALEALPKRSRNAVVLCYLRGQSLSDASRVLGCSSDALRMRLNRAILRMRSWMKGRGFEVSAVALPEILASRTTLAKTTQRVEDIASACMGKTHASAKAISTAERVAREMLWAKGKAIAAIAAGVLLACAGTGAIIHSSGPPPTPSSHQTATHAPRPNPNLANAQRSDETPRPDRLQEEVDVCYRWDALQGVLTDIQRRTGIYFACARSICLQKIFLVKNGLTFQQVLKALAHTSGAELEVKKLPNSHVAAILWKRAEEEALAALLEKAESKTAADRKRAVEGLGRLGDKRAVKALVRLCLDAEAGVRTKAMQTIRHQFAYSRVGTGRLVRESLRFPLLAPEAFDQDTRALLRSKGLVQVAEVVGDPSVGIEVCRGPGDTWRIVALWSLQSIADPNTCPTLLDLVSKGDYRFRAEAARALGRIGERRNVAALISAFKSAGSKVDERYAAWEKKRMTPTPQPEMALRTAVLQALGRIGGVQAYAFLVEALKSPSGTLRAAAASGLGETREKRAVEPLVALLEDPIENARRAAARSLAMIGSADAIEPLFAALLKAAPRHTIVFDARTEAQVMASALSFIRSDRLPALLVDYIKKEKAPVFFAARILGRLAPFPFARDRFRAVESPRTMETEGRDRGAGAST